MKRTGREILDRLYEFFNPTSHHDNTDNFINGHYNIDKLELGDIIEVKRVVCRASNIVIIVNYFIDHDIYIETKGECFSSRGLVFNKGFGRVVQQREKTTVYYE